MKKTQNNISLHFLYQKNKIRLTVILLVILLSISLYASNNDIAWTNNKEAVVFKVNETNLESILIDGKTTTYGKIIQKGNNVGFGNYAFYDSEKEKSIETPEALLNRGGGVILAYRFPNNLYYEESNEDKEIQWQNKDTNFTLHYYEKEKVYYGYLQEGENLTQGEVKGADGHFQLGNRELFSSKKTLDKLLKADTVLLDGKKLKAKDNSYNWSFRFSLAPNLGIYHFYNGHNIPNARYLTFAPYGFGVKADFGYYPIERLRLNLEYGYSLLFRYKHIIPKEEMVQYHKVVAGVEYSVINKNIFSLKLGLNGGALIGLNANIYDINSIIGTSLSASWTLNDSFAIGISTGASFSFAKHSDSLYNSMTYIVEPISIFTEIRF